MSIRQEDGEIKLGLGTKLALMYLEEKGITLERAEHQFLWWQQEQLKLGDAVFIPFQGNDGGYVRADAGGYQILLNFRGLLEKFRSVSLSDVLERRIPPDLMRNCVVLIGSTAESLNDRFYTPYSSSLNHSPKRTPGLLIHANITSQLLSAALDGRPLLQVWRSGRMAVDCAVVFHGCYWQSDSPREESAATAYPRAVSMDNR